MGIWLFVADSRTPVVASEDHMGRKIMANPDWADGEGWKRRQIDRRQSIVQSLNVGVLPTGENAKVHEYGRLLSLNRLGEVSHLELAQFRDQLGSISDEQMHKAQLVSTVYACAEHQNIRDYDSLAASHHDPYVNKTYFGRWPVSPQAHIRSLKGYVQIFPDALVEINKIIAVEGNTVVFRTTARGTQKGEIPGSLIGPAGKQVAVSLIHALEIIDGKIAAYESTNPFVNQWEADIINSSFPGLGGDVTDQRARQGVDADWELLVELLPDVVTEAGANAEELLKRQNIMEERKDVHLPTLIQRLYEAGPKQCQALQPQKMRRCAKMVASGSLYCEFHQKDGYGNDDG